MTDPSFPEPDLSAKAARQTSPADAAGAMTRRNFVHTLAATGVALGAQGWAAETKSGEMIYRTLGRTGEKVSALGLGGFHIGVPKDEQEGIRIVRSEIRMGKALRDGYRDKVFLMTKIDGRTKRLAAKQIDECLQRLQTDRIDLMQHHEVIRMEDPDRIFAEDGAMEAVLEAKKAGKIRYIGFTGHKDPLVHLRTLELATRHQFRFDAVQMPLNVMDAHFRSFAQQVVQVLVKEGIGVLGMKPLGSGAILQTSTVTAVECLHYTLNLPTSVVITGIDSLNLLDQAFEAARTFKPMNKAQVAALLARTKQLAMTGKYERFKTTPAFDATARHPDWLG